MPRNPARTLLNAYLKAIARTTRQDDAREESCHPTLERLLEVFAREGMDRGRIEAPPAQENRGQEFRFPRGGWRTSYLTVSSEARSSSEGKGVLIFQPILDETPTDAENAQITAVLAVTQVSQALFDHR